jgi:magnesium transporter
MPRTRLYRDGKLAAEGFPISEVSDHLADDKALVWFDLCAPSEEELNSIREELGLHSLAIEGALTEKQRPKLVHYEKHKFLAAYAVTFDADSGDVTPHAVAAFITDRALVTVRRDETFDIDEVVRRWDDNPDLSRYGIGFLLHGLLDYVVDTHMDAALALDQALEQLEDQLFDEKTRQRELQKRTFELRKSLLVLRRVVLPMREVVNTVLRHEENEQNAGLHPYVQDVYDHMLRAVEWTDSLRDFVATILDTQLTLRGNRLNVIMKQVTGWAAIIAVPTAVTGFYGMNVPYPGFGHSTGFWWSLVVIVATSATLYTIFKRKDWL